MLNGALTKESAVTRTPAAPDPARSGIDLEFRPSSYFWPLGLETHLLATIKGAQRRAALQRLIDAGRADRIPDVLAQATLSESERRAVGRIHPAFMGGEYLPDRSEREVEIARITIASVTRDVTSVYARRGRHRIYYRVVDEYEGETLRGKGTRTSVRPLTLGELGTFLDSAWSVLDVLAMNFGRVQADPDRLRAFARFASPFYPNFGRLYAVRIEAWAAEAVRRRVEAGSRAPA